MFKKKLNLNKNKVLLGAELLGSEVVVRFAFNKPITPDSVALCWCTSSILGDDAVVPTKLLLAIDCTESELDFISCNDDDGDDDGIMLLYSVLRYYAQQRYFSAQQLTKLIFIHAYQLLIFICSMWHDVIS